MKRKKWISMIMAVSLAVLTGCSAFGESQQKAEHSDSGQNGKETYIYMGAKLEIPDEIRYISSISGLKDGTVRICASDENVGTLKVWDSADNGAEWTENTVTETELAQMPADELYKFSSEGDLYIWNYESGKADISGKELTILADDTDMCVDTALSGDALTVLMMDESANYTLSQFDINSHEQIMMENDRLNTVLNGTYALTAGTDGRTIYLAGETVARYDTAEETIETILDSTALKDITVNPMRIVSGIAEGKDGGIILQIRDMDAERDSLYLLTKTKQTEETGLVVYSLEENAALRQMIALYRDENPGISVKYQIGYTGEDGVTVSDAIKSLNTDVLAGEGPDIIVLDGLPVEQYVEKGMLFDVTQLVEQEKDGIFYNIIEACNRDREIYAVPTSFSIPIVVGDKKTVGMGNTSDLIEKIAAQGNGSFSDTDFTVAAVSLFSASDIVGDNDIDKDALKKYFGDMKKLYDICLAGADTDCLYENYSLSEAGESYPQLYAEIALAIYTGNVESGISMLDTGDIYAEIVSLCKEKDVTYGNINADSGNYFVPSGILSINSKAEHQDEAKSFLEFCIIDGLSKVETEGFSINRNGYEKSMPVSENGAVYTSYRINDEAEDGLDVYYFTPEGLAETEKFIEKLDTPAITDHMVLETVMEHLESFLYDGGSIGNAVEDSVEKLELYLKE